MVNILKSINDKKIEDKNLLLLIRKYYSLYNQKVWSKQFIKILSKNKIFRPNLNIVESLGIFS
jgi:hypothetical protein